MSADAKPVPTLVRAYSVFDAFEHAGVFYDRVLVHWFARYRPQPVADYDRLIEGYADLPDRAQQYARQAVDELLTPVEAEQLQVYLRRHHNVPIVFQPIVQRTREAALAIPLALRPLSDKQGVYPLDEEPDYQLPLSIWGLYDVQACPLCPNAGPYLRGYQDRGVAFLQAALEALDIEDHTEEDLARVVDELLHQEAGFAVEDNDELQDHLAMLPEQATTSAAPGHTLDAVLAELGESDEADESQQNA